MNATDSLSARTESIIADLEASTAITDTVASQPHTVLTTSTTLPLTLPPGLSGDALQQQFTDIGQHPSGMGLVKLLCRDVGHITHERQIVCMRSKDWRCRTSR